MELRITKYYNLKNLYVMFLCQVGVTFMFNTLTARDVTLRFYFSFLYAEDILIRLSAKFDFDRFSVWCNPHFFSYENN